MKKQGILCTSMEPIITASASETKNATTPVPQPEVKEEQVIHHVKNIYPSVRHIVLTLIVLITLCVVIFLIHQNGKSIYDHGL